MSATKNHKQEAGPQGPASPVDPALAELDRRRAQLREAGSVALRSVALRDELILAAVGTGMSQREVARLVGLSHTAVQAIVRRATT